MNSANLVGLASLGDWGDVFFLSLGFTLGAVIFGFSIIPKTVRLAFFLSSFIFLSSTSTSYFAVIQSSFLQASGAEIGDWLIAITSFEKAQLVQFAIGFGAAIVFSLVAYIALLLATWTSGLILSRQMCPLNEQAKDSVFNLIILVCLVLFFLSDMPIKYFVYLDQFKSSESVSSASLVGKIISIGELALIYSVILALPLFIASLAVDLFSILLNRYFTEMNSDSMLFSIKIPLLVAGLAIMLIPFSEQIAALMAQSVTGDSLKGLFK